MVMDGGTNLSGSNYTLYDKEIVQAAKNKMRVAGGMMAVAKTKYNKELMARDTEDLEDRMQI